MTLFAKVWRPVRRHPQLFVGLAMVLVIVVFGPLGSLFVDTEGAKVGSAPVDRPPSAE
jgi:hypothetical protein